MMRFLLLWLGLKPGIFLAFASYMGFIVYQMDVKSAFLYGKIDEEVYVSQPLGFIDPKYPKKVYKVVKALYGLHQAPRAWYATLSTFLLKNGYRRGTIDKTLFIKKDKHDIILMSYMGELTFFLGLQVKQKEDGIFISQDKYVAEILKKFDFVSIKTASTPIETQKPLVKDEEASDVDVNPKTSHLSAVKRIFRAKSLTGNSTMEVVKFLGRRLISWQCKKQTILATSTTEAKYVAVANCCGQVLWIQNQMLDCSYLGFKESLGRALDGTEAQLLLKLFILWLAKVSTDSANLVPLGKDSTASETRWDEEFHEIIDFLARSSIHNALTSDPSPRPSPTTHIPDSIPEDSGRNHGGQLSSDKSLLGNEGDMTLQSVYDLCISLCT
ncbi:putative ribonuclease H-like domain-containing protein [Tanacetum coccineum]